MQDIVGRTWFGNIAEFEQGQNRCCQHHMTGKLYTRLWTFFVSCEYGHAFCFRL